MKAPLASYSCLLALILLISSGTGMAGTEDEVDSSLNEMLSLLYNMQTKLISEHGVFVSYCDTSMDSTNEQIEAYDELITESEALIDSYEPLLEADEEELQAIQEEYLEKEEELEEGQELREEETLNNQEEVSNIDEDLGSVEYLLTELDADTITMAQISSEVAEMHSQSSTTQSILKTVSSLLETQSINLETKNLLVEMLNQLGQEMLSMKELEIESEELADARWEELQVTLEARLDQLSITMSQLNFQVEIYRTIIADNEQQVGQYTVRQAMLNELLNLLDEGCEDENTKYSVKLSEINTKISDLESFLNQRSLELDAKTLF